MNFPSIGFEPPSLKLDLHCHTNRSDGRDSTATLVSRAKAVGLGLVAVTDHDRVNHEARWMLGQNGILSPESVEISVRDTDRGHSLHILLYAERVSERTDEILCGIREGRIAKIKAQCDLLAKHGFAISFYDLCEFAAGSGAAIDCLNNGILANYVLREEAGKQRARELAGREVKDTQDFIVTFLKENAEFPEIGYVKVENYEINVDDAIEIARRDGWMLSIAHPNFSFKKFGGAEGFEKTMRDYHARGIEGIEYNAFANSEWEWVTRRLANELDSILTFGSDYHGDEDERHGQLGEIHPSLTSSKEGAALLRHNTNRFVSRIFGRPEKLKFERKVVAYA